MTTPDQQLTDLTAKNKKIARVFPTKTNMSPTDPDAYFGLPMMFMPTYDEIHISVAFTWDIPRAKYLASNWRKYGKVIIGGPAIDGESEQPFKAGMYLKPGVTITSRGCPNKCSFCMVGQGLIEFEQFPEGNILQDNNVLACSKQHIRKVFAMLTKQKQIEFKGGLEKYRITSEIAEQLRGLRIKSLWLACDQPEGIKPLKKAVTILQQAGFKQDHIYCYVLIGKNMQEEEQRLREIWNIGCKPFAQLYRDTQDSIKYSKEWKQFVRKWSRPAISRAIMKGK